jgi:hypothetical protein
MALGQDAGEHRQGLFGAVLFVTGEQHDVLTGARAFAGGELEPAGASGEGLRGDGREREDKGGQGGPEVEMTLHGVKLQIDRPRVGFKRPVPETGFISAR